MIRLLHPPYALLADDMTGATDTGVQFVRAQCRVRTLFSSWNIRSLTGVDIVVVDTDSRNLKAKQAATIVRACTKQLLGHGMRVLYKKIDSTLRGPIGAELEAIMSVANFRQAILCPAYPAAGRTVNDGRLLVDGQPVSDTSIGHDLISPVKESHIPSLLVGQCSLPVNHIPLHIVEEGETAIAAILAKGYRQGAGVWVCDATEVHHLESLARVVAHTAGDVLAVGSAGLAEPLAQLVAPQLKPHTPAGMLFVCGSRHPVTRAQIAALVEAANAQQVEIEPTTADPADWEPWVREVGQSILPPSSPGAHLILTTPTAPTADLAPRAAACQLAILATYVLEMAPIAGVLATGGDTLRALLEQWQATGIDLLDEVAPGVPLGRVVGGQFAGMALISKAGGFGEIDLFRRVAGVLGGPEPDNVE